MNKTYYKVRQISTGKFLDGIGAGWGLEGMYFKNLAAVGRAVNAVAEYCERQTNWLERAKRERFDTYESAAPRIQEELAANVPANMEIVPYELMIGTPWPVGQKRPR